MQPRFNSRLVDYVHPLTGLAPTSIVTPGALTPPQIAKAYGVPPGDGYGITVGILALQDCGFSQNDLALSFQDLKNAGLMDANVPVPIINKILMDGVTGVFNANSPASQEATLDIYCVATMVPRAKINLYVGTSLGNPLAVALQDGCNVISLSYVYPENAGYVYESLLQAADSVNAALCVASGDWGSADPNGNFTLTFPSTSSHVISVGGTNLTLNANNMRNTEKDDNRDPGVTETVNGINVTGGFGGGGGISTLNAVPSWQSGLKYTPITNGTRATNTVPYSGGTIGALTPLTFRGAPDISAPMNAYGLYIGANRSFAAGTSAAAPLVAGILARYQQLTGVARGATAWNTLFYGNPNSFYDIQVGTNNVIHPNGYVGTAGWDAVTGLGAINADQFYKIIRTGTVFPRLNNGFRASSGLLYPRRTRLY